MPDQVAEIAADSLRQAGVPLPHFLGGMSDARAWAEFATADELKAHAVAAVEAMSESDRAAFLRHVDAGRLAA